MCLHLKSVAKGCKCMALQSQEIATLCADVSTQLGYPCRNTGLEMREFTRIANTFSVTLVQYLFQYIYVKKCILSM